MKNDFEILEHSADLKIKIESPNLLGLFKTSALGMFSAATGGKLKPQTSNPKSRNIEVTGRNKEELLINFLNELIFLADVFKEIYLKFKFQKFSQKEIIGSAFGSPVPKKELAIEIKAATIHDLKIQKTTEGFSAIILFDI